MRGAQDLLTVQTSILHSPALVNGAYDRLGLNRAQSLSKLTCVLFQHQQTHLFFLFLNILIHFLLSENLFCVYEYTIAEPSLQPTFYFFSVYIYMWESDGIL